MMNELKNLLKKARSPSMLNLAIIGALIVATVLGIYLADKSRMLTHFSTKPEACINCHAMDAFYASWQHSAHGRNTTCLSCHVPQNFIGKYKTKILDGLHHVFMFSFDKFGGAIKISDGGAKIAQDNCISCHARQGETVAINTVLNARTGLNADDKEYCWRCHRDAPHGAMSGLHTAPGNLGVKNLIENLSK